MIAVSLSFPYEDTMVSRRGNGRFSTGILAHQKYGDQTGDLGIVVASLRYILEDIPGFFPA